MEKKYISIDQLFKCETCYHMDGSGKCNSPWCDAMEDYRPAMNKLEFAGVAPVVHGRDTACCPNCGAKIDLEPEVE